MAKIAFVNDEDEIVGAGSKEEAWKNGILHRIVGVFILNSHGDLLIQKRLSSFSTSPGLWDKSAGGHVDEGEEYSEAARREIKEELGIENLKLDEIEKYFIKETDEHGIIKNRFHMLYKTKYDGPISFSKDEVAEVRWISLGELQEWMNKKPQDFVKSFNILLYEKGVFNKLCQ